MIQKNLVNSVLADLYRKEVCGECILKYFSYLIDILDRTTSPKHMQIIME